MGQVFFFSHSLRLTGIRRLELARSTRQYLREILTPALPRSAPTPYEQHVRVVSFFDAHANYEIPIAWGFLWASPWQNLPPNTSVNCLRAVLLRRTTIRASRPFLERLNVAKTRPPFDEHHMREVSFLNARTR